MESNYSDKLKDPRWQKKRLEIMERDDWTCQKCFDTESTLAVHHRRYIQGIEPWEYPDNILVTLCDNCHETEKLNMKRVSESLIEQIKEKFYAEDMQELAEGFNLLTIGYDSYMLSRVYSWVLSNEEMQRELVERFYEHLKTLRGN